MYTRNCPSCSKLIVYKNKSSIAAMSRKKAECRSCAYSKRQKMSADEAAIRAKAATRKFKHKLQVYVWNYLANNPCVDCGEKNILFLEFDHIHSKTEWVSFLIRRHASIETIKAEIDKCLVRCIGCHRIKTNLAYRDSKKNGTKQVQFINQYLSTAKCMDCNISNPLLLEFDHVRGVKNHNVSTLVRNGYSIQKIQEEIDKCEVVCCKCHRTRTATRGNWSVLNYIKTNLLLT
jgi:hypothetical protein